MGRRTSLWLADDLDARVKASGLTLAALIRRGLDTLTGPPESPARADTEILTVLLRIEDILKNLPGQFAEEAIDPLSEEEYEQQRAAWKRQREEAEHRQAEVWREQLAATLKDNPEGMVTAARAAVVFKMADGGARDRLRRLESYGLARRVDDGRPPHRWAITTS